MTPSTIFISKADNYRYSTSREDFRKMRMFMLRMTHLSRFSNYQLTDMFDDVWDLPVGGEIYFCDSDYELYHESTIGEFEETLKRMQRFSEKHKDGTNYAPYWKNMWVIKKTPKCFLLKQLDYDF